MSAGSGSFITNAAANDLRLAAIRMQILRDRMEGCNESAREEGRAPTHELIDEAQMFVDETKEAARLHERRVDDLKAENADLKAKLELYRRWSPN